MLYPETLTPAGDEEMINRSNNEAFNRLFILQSLLKKESALKELCKNILLKYLFRYKNQR
jgi:hypothetical protein